MNKIILFIFPVFLIVFLSLPFRHVYGQQTGIINPTPANPRVTTGSTIDRDYLNAGDRVNLEETVNGDAYIAGGNVTVSGTVNGDLIVAGGNITINGNIAQDVRILGGNVIISGKVGRNVSFAAGSVTVTGDATIGGTVNGVFGNLEYGGTAGRNMAIAGGSAHINGTITGDTEGRLGNLSLGEKARLNGNLTYESPNQAHIAQGATVSGKVSYTPVTQTPGLNSQEVRKNAGRFISGAKTTASVIGFISSFIIGYIILRLFPRRMMRKTEILKKRPWAAFAAGLIFLVGVPIASLILLIAILGIPIAFILMAVYFILLYLAKIWISLHLGILASRFLGAGERRGWALFFGLFLYYVIGIIPIIGPLVTFILALLGNGMFILEKKELYTLMVEKKLA